MENNKISKNEEEWKKELNLEQFHILREGGTEGAFSGKYWDLKEDGVYRCAGCGTELFDSDTKFESGSGWPSFYQPMENDRVEIKLDKSHGMVREEVVCANCGGHLGHRFPDGPQPTGQRFCMNSCALDFDKKDS